MGEHVLVTPLGLTPGAVSGLALALRKGDNGKLNNFTITRVVTIGTSHTEVKKVDALLKKLFYEVNIKYDSYFIPHAELREDERENFLAQVDPDLDNQLATELKRNKDHDSAAVMFMLKMGRVLEQLNKEGHTIHVGVTSGRSGMGALAALATNVYGANYLWHFWVSQEIEDMGRLDRLPKPITLGNNKYLDPTIVEGACQIVPLPFLNLRPYHAILEKYYRQFRTAMEAGREPEVPAEVAPIVTLLWNAGIQKLEDLFPATLPISAADRIVDMIRIYSGLQTIEQKEKLVRQLMVLLSENDILTEETAQRMELLVKTGSSPDLVLATGLKGADPQGLWKLIQENKLAILATSISAADMLVNAVAFWLQHAGHT